MWVLAGNMRLWKMIGYTTCLGSSAHTLNLSPLPKDSLQLATGQYIRPSAARVTVRSVLSGIEHVLVACEHPMCI